MKKRLIGVVIIIAIGVLVPVLLSQCVGSNNEADKSGDMRVYTVDPDGQTQSGAEGGEKSTANCKVDDGRDGDQGEEPPVPVAIEDVAGGQQQYVLPPGRAPQ